jgi:hypothetical protein
MEKVREFCELNSRFVEEVSDHPTARHDLVGAVERGSSPIPHDFWSSCTRIAGGSSPRRLERPTAVRRHSCAWSSPGSR